MENRKIISKLIADLRGLEYEIFNLLEKSNSDLNAIHQLVNERGIIIKILEKHESIIKECRETQKQINFFRKNNLIIKKRLEEKVLLIKKEMVKTKKAYLIHKNYGQQSRK